MRPESAGSARGQGKFPVYQYCPGACEFGQQVGQGQCPAEVFRQRFFQEVVLADRKQFAKKLVGSPAHKCMGIAGVGSHYFYEAQSATEVVAERGEKPEEKLQGMGFGGVRHALLLLCSGRGKHGGEVEKSDFPPEFSGRGLFYSGAIPPVWHRTISSYVPYLEMI